jgi:predicted NACHT family NTPase
MARRSLQASADGIKTLKATIKQKKWTQTYLAGAAGCSRQTIWSLLAGKLIDADFFLAICEQLGLTLQDVAEPEQMEQLPGQVAGVDELVRQVRRKLKPWLDEKCGWMRVLDMNQRIGLEDIYTDVNILAQITGRQRLKLEELRGRCNHDEIEQFGLSNLQKLKRIPGIDAVEQFSKLMILGKPGAGKTTFLKRIATQCNQGKLYPEKVVIFVTLRDFAETKDQPGLLDYIVNLLDKLHIADALDITHRLLIQGRLLLLLDGLDEVRQDDNNRTVKEVRQFNEQFPKNQLVITCRIAARDYWLEAFTEVEIADFDDQQIGVFVTKWFAHHDVAKTEPFLRGLQDKPRIRELATNPLLLTLLCWSFGESGYFNPSRSGLYKDGLEVLLKKWDSKRNIERDQIYKNLSVDRKQRMLSQLAYTTFEAGDYLFPEKRATMEIGNYIENLPEANTDPAVLTLDSKAVVRSIEAQHGLLAERAFGIYSFSHLTFHEYFTAQQIVASFNLQAALSNLLDQIHEKRWREVFLLTVELLPNEAVDWFLKAMKDRVDQILDPDPQLQTFLGWVQQKSESVETTYKTAAVRAFYFFLDLAHAFDRALDLDLARALDRALALDLDRALDLDLDFDFDLDLNPDLAKDLELLKTELPDRSANWDVWSAWDQNYSQAWTAKLRSIIVQHRNLGHDWQFSDTQHQKLQQYYQANLLLVHCLNSECEVSRQVRQKIEESLLLPIASLEP